MTDATARPVHGTYHPHPRGFGFIDTGDDPPEDSAFVPPPLARDLLDGDEVDGQAVVNERGLTATHAEVTRRRRRHVLATTSPVPRSRRVDLHAHPSHGTGQVAAAKRAAAQLSGSDDGTVVLAALDRDSAEPRAVDVVASAHPSREADAARVTAAALLDATDAETHLGLLEVDRCLIDAQLAATARGETLAASAPATSDDQLLPRRDLTDTTTVTVDDPSTRDLDDAVSARRTTRGHVRVDVHIADVAAHVPAGSPLDVRARTLATSLYLADHTAPMLPEEISEQRLSLLEGQPRDTLTVSFTVTSDGRVLDPQLAATRVTVDRRLSYEQVQRDMNRRRAGADPVQDTVSAACLAAEWLGEERDRRAVIAGLFDSPAQRIRVRDGSAVPEPADDEDDAHQVIERLMVAANEVVAEWLRKRRAPALYRVHDGVDPARADLLTSAAPDLPDYTAGTLRTAIDDADERQSATIATAVAAAMGRAGYSTDPDHHFGIDSRPYTHFTSPLRRYADLVVHRAVRAELAGGARLDPAEVQEVARWVTARSAAAARAEARERDELWARHLTRRLDSGEEVRERATVQRVTPAGVAVRLPSLGLRGFVPAHALNGGRRLELSDDELATADRQYQVGDSTSVRLDSVDRTGRLVLVPATR